MKYKILFALLFTFLFISKVNAQEVKLKRTQLQGVYYVQRDPKSDYYSSYSQSKYEIDNRIAYCIEPNKAITTDTYTIGDINKLNIKDKLNYITLIGYYGYEYKGHNTDKYFMAAQELIWEYISGYEVDWYTGINGTGEKVNIEKEKQEIKELVNNHYKLPSFNRYYIQAVAGNTYTIEDTNKVLNNYEVISNNTHKIKIENNKLIFELSNTTLGNENVELQRKNYDNLKTVLFVAEGSQSLMAFRPDDITKASLTMNTASRKGFIKITKKGEVIKDFDENYKFSYELEPLDNIKCGIYAKEDIIEIDGSRVYKKDELIQKLIVNKEALSNPLPKGKYYIKELETKEDYILDNNIYDIEIKTIGTVTVELINKLKRPTVSIEKLGEQFISYNNYKLIPMESEFALYTNEDIKVNDKIIKKDTLIRSFKTVNGKYEINEIPKGKYYIKEINTLKGYIIDNKKYEFELNNENIKIGPITNKLIKTNISITKIDSKTKKELKGCLLGLYDKDNNLIVSKKTDKNGNIIFENIPYGSYYIKEIESPEGYKINNKKINVDIENNELIKINIENDKIEQIMPNTNGNKISISLILLLLSLPCIFYKKHEK